MMAIQFSGITHVALDLTRVQKTENGHTYITDWSGLNEKLEAGIQAEMDRMQGGDQFHPVSAFPISGTHEALVIDGQDLRDFAFDKLQMEQQFLSLGNKRETEKRRNPNLDTEEALQHPPAPRYNWGRAFFHYSNRDTILALAQHAIIERYQAKVDKKVIIPA